jgi:hypothetical protein
VRKIKLEFVEIFYGHQCNLNCKGCTSASDLIKTKNFDPSIDSIIQSIDNLEKYVSTKNIKLMGGEIFLYWDTIEIITEKIRQKFPKATIHLITNGLLLQKYQEKLLQFLDKFHPVSIDVSDHFILFSKDTTSKKFYTKLKDFIDQHQVTKVTKINWELRKENTIKINNLVKNIKNTNLKELLSLLNRQEVFEYKNKNKTTPVTITKHLEFFPGYYTNTNGQIKPYATKDPVGSYKNGCSMPNCHIIKDSKLYKCSWFMILPALLKVKNQKNDKDWEPYLNYKPLDFTNITEKELQYFYKTRNSSIPLCDMCSNNPKNKIPHIKENVLS